MHELSGLNLPVSSSDIRRQLCDGLLAKVALPHPVLDYIHEQQTLPLRNIRSGKILGSL